MKRKTIKQTATGSSSKSKSPETPPSAKSSVQNADPSDAPGKWSSEQRISAPPQNPGALKKIPAHIVAGIAAQLCTAQDDPCLRILKAYDLLDVAESARSSLLTCGSYSHGVEEFRWMRSNFKTSKQLEEEIQTAPAFFWGMKGEPRLQFEPVLHSLFGGKKRKIKTEERESRIERVVTFLQEASSMPDIAKKLFGRIREVDSYKWMVHGADRAKAQNLVDQWIREGMPNEAYMIFKHNFAQWWENKVATQNSRNRKGKRAESALSCDGPKGPRIPSVFDKQNFSEKKHLTRL